MSAYAYGFIIFIRRTSMCGYDDLFTRFKWDIAR